MLSCIYSGALNGVEASLVEIEVNSGEKGEPRIFMVGLPDVAVKESADRVSSALANSGFSMPKSRLTINLAPGDMRKEGPLYDLPIALGILASTGIIDSSKLSDYIIAGELSLSGDLRWVSGSISLALLARSLGKKGLILPVESANEAVLVSGIEVLGATSLKQICNFFNGQEEIVPLKISDSPFMTKDDSYMPDFADVKGQENVRRAVEVAVAGGHNILMIGTPGAGKSMIAKRIPSIIPEPTLDEFLEILGIYSAAGLSQSNKFFKRPFRSPHHTISDVGLIGGGVIPKPGEISLAHNGVLFLDELPEFKRSVLEVLRQPLEDGLVSISRSAGKISIASKFMLVAAMNPCPCGYLGDSKRTCRCSPTQISNYRSRISGPLLDRIDIHVEAQALPLEALGKNTQSESSNSIRQRVIAAREIQKSRFQNEKFSHASKCNASMNPKQIKKFCALNEEQSSLLASAMEELNLSARAWDKILKVSRTIADLDSSNSIQSHHLLEAINYRAHAL